MTIANEIDVKIADYEAKSSRGVLAIYLGRIQMRSLLYWAQQNGYQVPERDESEKTRREYNGCKVFVVDAEEHLAVA